ncbi:MAG: hypothetical protein N2D54_06865 [Chloroflexota bacterium]
MAQIKCGYEDCVFLSKGYCKSPTIELDPEDGCLTFSDDMSELTEIIMDDEDDMDSDNWEDAGFEELEDLRDED